MKKMNNARGTALTVLAASLAAAFGAAQAQETDEVARQRRPESTVSVGAGYLTDDAARYGQFTGLKESGLYFLGDVDLVRRDDATGTWLRAGGRNLGLDTRELRFEQERQGDWRYGLEYNQIVRNSPYLVNSGLDGVGRDAQTTHTVAPGAGGDQRLKVLRESLTLAGKKTLGMGLDTQVRFKTEKKEGDRLFGYYPGVAPVFLVEPIDHTMNQLDATIGFANGKLQLTGGYYGSFFQNERSGIVVNGAAASPVTLAPDNEAHQAYVSGGYSFSPTTRANFKLARGLAMQNDKFPVGATQGAAGRTNLGGRVETTLAQLGFSARPLQKLSLIANYKYEDRDDETPVRQYFAVTTSATNNTFNEPRSLRSHVGKVEASYLLPADFRVVGGVDYEERHRNIHPVRQVTFRQDTEELSYRAELRRSLSETLNGSIAYIHSERDGSDFKLPGLVRPAGPVAPYNLADRDREKVRAKLDWAPIEPLSVQLLADLAEDDYSGGNLGLDKGRSRFWSVDASYSFTDNWQGLAWASREYTRAVNRTSWGNSDANSLERRWSANLRQRGEAFGLGFRGTISPSLKVGGDVQYAHDQSDYGLNGNLNTAAGMQFPADVRYTATTVKLFADYAMRRDLSLRLNVIHDRWDTNDWLWNYVYADGTTVTQDESQETNFVGVTMRYTFQ